jgi:hypothetical protein
MPTGLTLPTNLANSMQVFVGDLTYINPQDPVLFKLFDTVVLPEGEGIIYNEPVLGTISSFAFDPNNEFTNPQTLADSKIQVTPSEKGTQIQWPKRLAKQWKTNWMTAVARVTSESIERYVDTDLTNIFGSATGILGGGTMPFNRGIVSAGMAVIRPGIPANGNAGRAGAPSVGERSKGPWYGVIHPFNIHDLDVQMTGTGGGVSQQLTGGYDAKGNFPVAVGIEKFQADWIADHYQGRLAGAEIFDDQNLVPDGSNRIKGGLFSKYAAVTLTYQLLQKGESLSGDTRFVKQTIWRDYGYAIRNQAWMQALWLDAAVPTT